MICFNQAFHANPNLKCACYNEGDIYLNLNMFDKAIVCFKKVLSLDPQDVKAQKSLTLANKILEAQHNTAIETSGKVNYEHQVDNQHYKNLNQSLECGGNYINMEYGSYDL